MKKSTYKWIPAYKGHSLQRLYIPFSQRLLPYDADNPFETICEINHYQGLVRYEVKPATVLHFLYVAIAQRTERFIAPIVDWYKIRT